MARYFAFKLAREARRFAHTYDGKNNVSAGFAVWLEWYNAVVNGEKIFGIDNAQIRKNLERDMALGSREGRFDKKFWKRDIAVINADIARWVEEAKAEDAALREPSKGNPPELPPESAVQQPHRAVTQFGQGARGEIIALPNPFSPASGRSAQDLQDHYEECCEAALDLKALGANQLGIIASDVEGLLPWLPDNWAEANVNRVWSKTIRLRERMALHQAALQQPAALRESSQILEAETASRLNAFVSQANVLFAMDEKASELEQLSFGTQERAAINKINEALAPLVAQALKLAAQDTRLMVAEDLDRLPRQPRDMLGDKEANRVAKQSQNFVMAMVRVVWGALRAVQAGANESLVAAAAQTGEAGPRILEFVLHHKAELGAVATGMGVLGGTITLVIKLAEMMRN